MFKIPVIWISKSFSNYQIEYLDNIKNRTAQKSNEWIPEINEYKIKKCNYDISIEPETIQINKPTTTRDDFKIMGHVIEKKIIDQLKKKYSINNYQLLYKLDEFKPLVIYGKIDGIITLEKKLYLLEIKLRIHNFYDITTDEYIQIHLYMYMTGLRACLFIQIHKGNLKCEMVNYSIKFIQHVFKNLNDLKRLLMV